MQENIRAQQLLHGFGVWLVLAGKNSPAFARYLSALNFLFPKVWSEFLRSALFTCPGALHPTLGRAEGKG